MSLHEDFMAQALVQAQQAGAQGEVPVGAVVVCEGKVVARAHNLRRQTNDPCGHAEILAIRQAAQVLGRWQLDECTLYVTLEPCPMCAGAIGQARMQRVVYGAFDPRLGCAGSVYELCGDRKLAHHTQILGGVSEEACAKLLSDFFRGRREKSE